MEAVFRHELFVIGRRGRFFALRLVYAGFLVVQILPILFVNPLLWQNLLSGVEIEEYFERFLTQQFVLLAFFTPILAAGAITEEKQRGALDYLLAADLRSGEIILGKWLARSWQVFLIALVGLPLWCFFTAFLTDWRFLPVLLAVTGLWVFGLAALS